MHVVIYNNYTLHTQFTHTSNKLHTVHTYLTHSSTHVTQFHMVHTLDAPLTLTSHKVPNSAYTLYTHFTCAMNITVSQESSQFGEALKLKVWGECIPRRGASLLSSIIGIISDIWCLSMWFIYGSTLGMMASSSMDVCAPCMCFVCDSGEYMSTLEVLTCGCHVLLICEYVWIVIFVVVLGLYCGSVDFLLCLFCWR